MSTLGVAPSTLWTETPEGDRITQRIHSGDAVFPLGARGSAQQICRARFGVERVALPGGSSLAPESENARGKQRDADHIAEDAFIAMPADRGAGAVLCDQRVRQVFRRQLREGGRALPQCMQEGRNLFGRVQRAF